MRLRTVLVIGALALALAAGGGWFWLHRSSLVAGNHPHGTHVIAEHPVAVLAVGAQRVTVSGDGALMPGTTASSALPEVSVSALPSGGWVTDQRTLAMLAVLGTAPDQLLGHVQGVADNSAHGVVVQLRDGPSVYFGAAQAGSAKWTAAADVLADPGAAGAGYIDVTDPRRPAAGAR